MQGLGIASVVGWIDGHGRLKPVETARQRWPGQLDREWLARADGSLHGAQRLALIVSELAAG